MDETKARIKLVCVIAISISLITYMMLLPFISWPVKVTLKGETPITVVVREMDGEVAWRGFVNKSDNSVTMLLPAGKYSVYVRWPGHGETSTLTVHPQTNEGRTFQHGN